MTEFHTVRRVPHSPENMFALVANVERYPEFVPLCEALQVRGRETDAAGNEVIVAGMSVAYKFLRERFTSRVTLKPDANEIVVEYLDGPFRFMRNRWHFGEAGEGACNVDFYLAYELRSRTLQMMVGAVFDKAFAKFARSFEARADEVYGRPDTPQASVTG